MKAKKITDDELSAKEKRLEHDNLNNGKMGEKTYSTNEIGENSSSVNELLLFTVYWGIFFSFLILIWNIRSKYLNLVMSCFGIIIIVLLIIFIFLLKKR
jgi:hypothetical protein